MKTLLTAIFAIVLSLPAIAETAFIDDTLFVPLRSGAGTSFRIVHKGLKSGTRLEVVNRDADTGYSLVRTSSGIEGYLPTRYLVTTPIARVRLAETLENIAVIQEQNKQLKAKLSELESAHQTLNDEHESTVNQLNSSTSELSNIKSISANALNLDRRNKELHQSNEELRNELELVRTENLRLKDKSESNMMMIGGGLVLLGVIIALLIPMLKPSKKNDSWA